MNVPSPTLRPRRMTVRRWLATSAVLAVLIAISMWAFELGSYDPSRRLGCVILGEPTCMLGTAPKISVSLINHFGSDIYLVGSLDASDCQWRYPFCYFEVTGPNGKKADPSIGRCGNMNPLREKDFVRLPTGGKFDPYQRIDEEGFFSSIQLSSRTFSSTGKYRIRFVYSTRNGDIRDWRGSAVASDAKILSMFERVPKVEVKSNEIAIIVVAAGGQNPPTDPAP
jgi:hypothetical protein